MVVKTRSRSSSQQQLLSPSSPSSPNLFISLSLPQPHQPCISSSPTFTSPYESLRLQRIAENQARMDALGVQKQAANLTAIFKATKPRRSMEKRAPKVLHFTVRRSDRLKQIATPDYSENLDKIEKHGTSDKETTKKGGLGRQDQVKQFYRNYSRSISTPANAPVPKYVPRDLSVSAELKAYRCINQSRGSLYDSIVGICCHFCRQKKLCGEVDCERCGNRDVTKPCLGKTDCSRCHSNTGVFCRGCLKIRYGEEIEVARNSHWLCPHCSEDEGKDPYWICNSSICLSRRKITPTGIAIFKARELGFNSVAHYLADLLKKQGFRARKK